MGPERPEEVTVVVMMAVVVMVVVIVVVVVGAVLGLGPVLASFDQTAVPGAPTD